MTDVLTSDHIASVSLADADKDPQGFANELGRSFVDYGFAVIRDHGIPQDLIDRAEQKSKQFFALSEEVKKKYFIEGQGGARGYTPFGIETAKGLNASDLKEFWHVGRELPAGHKFGSSMPPNVWPLEVPSFKDTFLELYEAFDLAGLKVLRAIARFLKVDEVSLRQNSPRQRAQAKRRYDCEGPRSRRPRNESESDTVDKDIVRQNRYSEKNDWGAAVRQWSDCSKCDGQ